MLLVDGRLKRSLPSTLIYATDPAAHHNLPRGNLASDGLMGVGSFRKALAESRNMKNVKPGRHFSRAQRNVMKCFDRFLDLQMIQ